MSTGSTVAIVNKLVNLIISFASVPLILSFLGKDRYGLWMVVLSTLGFTSFLDIGLTPTLRNKLSEAYAERDLELFGRYSSAGLVMGVAIFIVGVLLGWATLFINWAAFLNITDPLSANELQPLVGVVVLLLMISLALGMVDAIYVARLRIAETKIYSLVASVVGFGVLLLGIYFGASLPTLALITLGPGLIARFILLVKLQTWDLLSLDFNIKPIFVIIKQLIPSSLLFMGIQFFAVVISSLPNIMVAKYLNLESVAVFSIAYKLVTIPLFLIAEILPVFWPAFTVAWRRKETAWLRSRLKLIIVGTTVILSFCGVLFAFFGQWAIGVWTGDKIVVPNNVLLWLSVWLVAQGCAYWMSTFLHSISDFAFELIVYGANAALLFTLSFWLVGYYGLLGVGLSLLLSILTASIVPMAFRMRFKLQIT